MNTLLEETNDRIHDSYIYLSDYKNDYIEDLESIKECNDPEDLDIIYGEIVYDEISNQDGTPEYEAGFIIGVKQTLKYLNKLMGNI